MEAGASLVWILLTYACMALGIVRDIAWLVFGTFVAYFAGLAVIGALI